MSNLAKKISVYLPIALSIAVILGILLGTHLNFSPVRNTVFFNKFNKLNEILNYVVEEYVDTIDRTELTEDAIRALLKNLDPHSAYITADELKSLNEPLEGNFDGIGIEFNIIKDTIVVISPISGGPSHALGIEAGDRIIKIEDELVAGTGIRNKDVMNWLRGPSGSKVSISILRRGTTVLIDYIITRGKIPIQSRKRQPGCVQYPFLIEVPADQCYRSSGILLFKPDDLLHYIRADTPEAAPVFPGFGIKPFQAMFTV